ncbi:MAG TPA: SseB family protein, partial [Arthrobacter sp.]
MDPRDTADTAANGPAPRHLPGHIAAALAGAGGPADSAGRPWAGRSLAGDESKIHNFEDDDGTADAGYLAAVVALLDG